MPYFISYGYRVSTKGIKKQIFLMPFIKLIGAKGGDSCGNAQNVRRNKPRASEGCGLRVCPRKASARSGNQQQYIISMKKDLLSYGFFLYSPSFFIYIGQVLFFDKKCPQLYTHYKTSNINISTDFSTLSTISN